MIFNRISVFFNLFLRFSRIPTIATVPEVSMRLEGEKRNIALFSCTLCFKDCSCAASLQIEGTVPNHLGLFFFLIFK